jgi:cytochrome P450
MVRMPSHTSCLRIYNIFAQNFTHSLYNLAVMPHYIQPLREEVEAVITKEGWSKASLAKMHKVDSFLKETLRHGGLGLGAQFCFLRISWSSSLHVAPVTLNRKALKDFTFSDGTVIPKNTFLYAAAFAIHRDEENYTNSNVFDGFRFADMGISGGESAKYQFVRNTSMCRDDLFTFGFLDVLGCY